MLSMGSMSWIETYNPLQSSWLLQNCLWHGCTSISWRQVTTVDFRVCNWVDDYICPRGVCRVRSGSMDTLISHQLDFFSFNDMCKCCLPCLSITLYQAINWCISTLDCFGITIGHLWPMIGLDVTHSCKKNLNIWLKIYPKWFGDSI